MAFRDKARAARWRSVCLVAAECAFVVAWGRAFGVASALASPLVLRENRE